MNRQALFELVHEAEAMTGNEAADARRAWFEKWVVEVGTQYEITKQEGDHVQAISEKDKEAYWVYRKEGALRELVKEMILRGYVSEEIHKPAWGGERRVWRIDVLRRDHA